MQTATGSISASLLGDPWHEERALARPLLA